MVVVARVVGRNRQRQRSHARTQGLRQSRYVAGNVFVALVAVTWRATGSNGLFLNRSVEKSYRLDLFDLFEFKSKG